VRRHAVKRREWDDARSLLTPVPLSEHPVLRLQRSAGNRAVTALIQAGGVPVVQREAATLVDPSARRKETFAIRGRSAGLDAGQIDQLWSVGGGRAAGGFAPAEERTAALYNAAQAVATGASVFYVEFKVEGLADLNAKMGHSGANTSLAQARSAVHDQLATVSGDVTALRGSGATFGFLVTGGTEAALWQRAASIGATVGERLGLTMTAAVMDPDDAATSAVAGDLARDASVAQARQGRTGSQSDGPSARFTSTGTDRRSAFAAMAADFGVEAAAAADLYGALVESRPDALTGFERGADREATTHKAAQQASKSGTAGVYVEVDVRNLGGLNRALGKGRADQVFAQIASITEGEMRSISDLADAWPFRHGGDEFSFVVVARRAGIDAAQLEFAVAAALTRAARMVSTATAEFAATPHIKPGRLPGTGIVWGTSVIGPAAEPEKVFSVADGKVETKKRSRAR